MLSWRVLWATRSTAKKLRHQWDLYAALASAGAAAAAAASEGAVAPGGAKAPHPDERAVWGALKDFLESFQQDVRELRAGSAGGISNILENYSTVFETLMELLTRPDDDADGAVGGAGGAGGGSGGGSRPDAVMIDHLLHSLELILDDEGCRSVVLARPRVVARTLDLLLTLESSEHKRGVLRLVCRLRSVALQRAASLRPAPHAAGRGTAGLLVPRRSLRAWRASRRSWACWRSPLVMRRLRK